MSLYLSISEFLDLGSLAWIPVSWISVSWISISCISDISLSLYLFMPVLFLCFYATLVCLTQNFGDVLSTWRHIRFYLFILGDDISRTLESIESNQPYYTTLLSLYLWLFPDYLEAMMKCRRMSECRLLHSSLGKICFLFFLPTNNYTIHNIKVSLEFSVFFLTNIILLYFHN